MQQSPAPLRDIERAAMLRALDLAALGPADDPNPQVGCVIIAPDGTTLAEGHHRGAGTPHAEAAALADASSRGVDVRGATAVITLEPCRHTGRTGPCSRALREAGIGRVVHALPDPGESEGGGAAELAAAGVEVIGGPAAIGPELTARALDLLEDWYGHAAAGAMHLVLKTATSLDGRVAAADGSSRWITGEQSRRHAHQVRARTDALIVGTGTVLADDPSLTVRLAAADAPHAPAPHADAPHADVPQPWRVVVGRTPVPPGAAVRGTDGRFLPVASRSPRRVLAELAALGVRRAVLEGGPRLASAFLRAGLVDELNAYIAPVHLGAGAAAIGDLGIGTIADARRWRTTGIHQLGDDVLLTAVPADRHTADQHTADQHTADQHTA